MVEYLKVGDLVEWRCPMYGLVVQWTVDSIRLGGLREESVVELRSVSRSNHKGNSNGRMFVPECLTRELTIAKRGFDPDD